MTYNVPDGSDSGHDADKGAVNKIGSFVSDHPLATAGAAIAVGAVIGVLLPRWKVAASAGSAVTRTASRAAKAIATAETARTLISSFNSATDTVKDSAHKLADHLPDADAVKAGAKRALEHASETAQKAGEQVARTARRIRSGED